MIEIEIRTPQVDGDHERVEWVVLASLRVSGEEYELEDHSGVIDLALAVPSLRGSGSLHFDEDREEWARGLPAVYRGPELIAAVISDDRAIPDRAVVVEREAVIVAETAAAEHAVG